MFVAGAEVDDGEEAHQRSERCVEALRRGLRILWVLANSEVLVRTRRVRKMKKKSPRS